MNTRTAVLTVALATASIAALAAPDPEAITPLPFEAGGLLVALPDSNAVVTEGMAALPHPITGLSEPEGLAFAPDGLLLVAEGGADRVQVFDGSGLSLGFIGVGSGLDHPAGLAVGADG